MPATKLLSVEEYFLLEESADEKHEYYQGEIFAMAGGSIAHNQIVTNTTGELHSFLKGKSCQVFNSDQKIYVETVNLFTYPDLSIVCGEPERWNNRNDILTNPAVIFEVLSKKTQNYDRGNKFKFFRSLPSLKEYVLISSMNFLIERYTKQSSGFWTLRETTNPEETFVVETINFSCPIKDLYLNVAF